MLFAVYFALLINFVVTIDANNFTNLEELLETHQRLTKDLDAYVNIEEVRLNTLKRYLDIFESEQRRARKDIPSYVGHPINAFTLIKRLASDVYFIKTHIKNGAEYAQNITRNHDDLKYPSSKDLLSSAVVIARFQLISKLYVKQVVNGIPNNITYGSSMTASDYYELGRVLFKKQDFVNSIEWMTEALHKYNSEKNAACPHMFSATDAIQYISLGYYELGDLKSALQWIQNIFFIDPDNSRAKQISEDYRKRIDYENKNFHESRCRCSLT